MLQKRNSKKIKLSFLDILNCCFRPWFKILARLVWRHQ